MVKAPCIRSHQVRSTVTESQVHALIDRVYAASLETEKWEQFLASYAETVGASSANFNSYNLESDSMEFLYGVGLDDGLVGYYVDHYYQHDLWREPSKLISEGTVSQVEQMVPKETYFASEFYNEFLAPQDVGYGNFLTVTNNPQRLVYANVFRPAYKEDFGASESQLASLLFPHIRRALEIGDRLNTLSCERDTLTSGLDLLSEAMVLLDDTGRIVFMNEAADAILSLGDGLSTKNNQLIVENVEATRKLATLIFSCIKLFGGGLIEAGGVTSIPRPSGKASYSVFVTPLKHGSSGRQEESSPKIAVLITDPMAKSTTSQRLLAKTLGITVAEAQTVRCLMDGLSTREIADARSVTIGTARQQIKSILAKTGCRNRADLVRLVLTSNFSAT